MKEKIEKLKETERGKAILKLIGYAVFIVFVLIFIAISGAIGGNNDRVIADESEESIESTAESTEVKERTYLEKQEKLINGPYEFVYKITGETEVQYSGKYENGVTEGFKETTSETVKYKIENGTVYSVKLDKQTEYKDLYLGIDADLFDFTKIFDKLNGSSTVIDKSSEIKKYTYKEINGYNYVISLDEEKIVGITVDNETLKYEFTFTYSD